MKQQILALVDGPGGYLQTVLGRAAKIKNEDPREKDLIPLITAVRSMVDQLIHELTERLPPQTELHQLLTLDVWFVRRQNRMSHKKNLLRVMLGEHVEVTDETILFGPGECLVKKTDVVSIGFGNGGDDMKNVQRAVDTINRAWSPFVLLDCSTTLRDDMLAFTIRFL